MESMQVFSSLKQIIYSKVNSLAAGTSSKPKIQPLQKRIQQG